jgi:hypothetical protein
MLRGFWKPSWVETKVFVREPLAIAVGCLALSSRVFRWE